jgi:hypothetical protein
LYINTSTTIQETILQILEYAQPFEDWASRIDNQPLTIKTATNVARSAIALLTKSEKAVELTVTPVTPKVENFSQNSEIQPPVNFGDLIETDVTGVTEQGQNSPNPCDERVLEGNASVECREEIAVLPEVTPLPESEWMSEENLQAIAVDLEWCVSVEQFQVFKDIYNPHSAPYSLKNLQAMPLATFGIASSTLKL